MKIPIKIENIEKRIPIKGVWYDYFGTIFISVIRKSNPYTRRLLIPNDKKKDNDLSEWHRIWQYDKIEFLYGVNVLGKKSYEITIRVGNQVHRIDSLVRNLAIEFQHTLSVDLEEMNLRFEAHKIFGYLPYLVIDLTSFTLEEFKQNFKSEIKTTLSIKIDKWIISKYSKSNNLFIDLKNGLVRIVDEFEIGFIEIGKEQFLNNLLQIENELAEKIIK